MPKKLANFLAPCLILAPLIFMVWVCLSYGVNFPYWDQWTTPGFLLANKVYENQPITWSDLLAQHNESRKLFPKLIFLGLASLTHWNIKIELMVNCLLSAINLTALYFLAKQTVKNPQIRNICLILSSLLLFAPVQYENYLWGIQICVFLSLTALIVCLSLFQPNFPVAIKAIAGAILCTFSTFSFANGMLSWLVVMPALVIDQSWSIANFKKRLPWLLFWLVLMGTSLWIYFHDYVKPGGHPAFSAAIKNPATAILYFRIFFGGPLGGFDKDQAMIVGEVILVLWLVSLGIVAYRSLRDETILPLTKSWILLGGYSLASGLITTFGRVGFGVAQALASRYTTFSALLYISLIFIVAILLQESHFSQLYSRVIKAMIGGLIGVGLILHISTNQKAFTQLQSQRFARLQGQACAVLSPVLEDGECLTTFVYPNLEHLRYLIGKINGLGYLHPPLLETAAVESFAEVNSTPETVGYFDELSPISETTYHVHGWARLPQRQEPADAILLSYQGEQIPPKVFHRVQRMTLRKDVTALFDDRPSSWLWGWDGDFPRSKLPPGQWVIKAWAFDTIKAKAFQLSGQFSLTVKSS